MMLNSTRLVTLLVALAAASPISAQETAAPETTDTEAAQPEAAETETAPAETTEATPAADGVGETYVAESFDAWQLRCVRTDDGSDPCQLYQLLKDKGTDKPIAEITIVALPEGGDAAAGATVITPLETLLTQQLNISVDGGPTKRYPFTFCAEVGCVARVGFTAAEVDGFRKGSKATIIVVPVADPSRTVDIEVSLKGFTAGFEAVEKATPKKE